MSGARFVLTLSCPNRPGIVAAVSTALFEGGFNIFDAQQFDDIETGNFFMRVAFNVAGEGGRRRGAARAFRRHRRAVRHELDAARASDEKKRVALLVSRFDHCLVDLLYRWRSGELPMEPVAIIANYPRETYEHIDFGDIPFHHLPVTKQTKMEQEAQALGDGARVEGRPRRARPLHADPVRRPRGQAFSGKCINIHHSFLPGFKGAKPYHQAHERGVKLIGATAHFVTSDLDEGPIIEQDVERISHRDTPEDLVRKGRDIERRVLARALSYALEGPRAAERPQDGGVLRLIRRFGWPVALAGLHVLARALDQPHRRRPTACACPARSAPGGGRCCAGFAACRGFLPSGLKKPAASSFSSRYSKKAIVISRVAGGDGRAFDGGRRRRVAVRGLEPFVADQQHRLREIERGIGGIGGKGEDRVGERHLVVVEPGALRPEQHAALLVPSRATVSAMRGGRASARAWPGRARARSRRRRNAGRRWRLPSCRTPAPRRGYARRRRRRHRRPPCIRPARGQPAFGLTRRRSSRPKLAMARAHMPILTASCGRTSTTAGPPPTPAPRPVRSRSCHAGGVSGKGDGARKRGGDAKSTKLMGRTGGRPPKLIEDDVDIARTLLANPDILVALSPTNSAYRLPRLIAACPPRGRSTGRSNDSVLAIVYHN